MLMPGGCPRKRGVNQAKWHMSNRDSEESNIFTTSRFPDTYRIIQIHIVFIRYVSNNPDTYRVYTIHIE